MGLQVLVEAIELMEMKEAAAKLGKDLQRSEHPHPPLLEGNQLSEGPVDSTGPEASSVGTPANLDSKAAGEGDQEAASPLAGPPSLLPPDVDWKKKRRKLRHNISENGRRKVIRNLMQKLKVLLPPPIGYTGAPNGKLWTTSLTLIQARKYIKELEKMEEQHNLEMEGLKRRKAEMEEKIAELMKKPDVLCGGQELEIPTLPVHENHTALCSTSGADWTPSKSPSPFFFGTPEAKRNHFNFGSAPPPPWFGIPRAPPPPFPPVFAQPGSFHPAGLRNPFNFPSTTFSSYTSYTETSTFFAPPGYHGYPGNTVVSNFSMSSSLQYGMPFPPFS